MGRGKGNNNNMIYKGRKEGRKEGEEDKGKEKDREEVRGNGSGELSREDGEEVVGQFCGTWYGVVFFARVSGHGAVLLTHPCISSGERPVEQVQYPVSASTIHIHAIRDVQVPMHGFEPACLSNKFEHLFYGLRVQEHSC